MHRAYICVCMGEFLSPFLVSQMIRQEQTFCNIRDIYFGSCWVFLVCVWLFLLSLCSDSDSEVCIIAIPYFVRAIYTSAIDQ